MAIELNGVNTAVSSGTLVVGGYRLVNVMATGQNSQVWEATREGDHRHVAVKLLLPERLHTREHIQYLKHEAQVAKQLEHPNIIKVLHYDSNKGNPFFVMEFFPAPNLKVQILRDLEFVRQKARRIITQVAQALAYTHDKGWVHRDVKPDNVLANKSGEVRLIDFALATRAQRGWRRFLAPRGTLKGTRSYMAPEQIRNRPVDGRTDIYSLGVTIFEMLAGRPPFRGSSPDDLLFRHLRTPPPSLRDEGVDVTPEFDRLVLRMLAKKPEDRPENLHNFLLEFRRVRILEKDPVAQEEMMGG